MVALSPFFLNNQLAFRGVASFWVFMGHLLYGEVYQAGFAGYEGWGWLGQLMILHFLAVDGFFIISGCLLTLGYWDQFTSQVTGRQIDRFYLLRLARIYPMHLLGVAVIGGYAVFDIPHPLSSGLQDVLFAHWEWGLILNLTGMHAWGIMPVAAWNEPAWTISAMMLLYILFPNLLLLLRRVPSRYYGAVIIALLGGYYMLRQVVALGGNSDGAGAIVRSLVFFTIGMCLARLSVTKDWNSLPWNRLFESALLLFAVGVVAWWRIGPFDMVVFHVLTTGLVITLLYADGASAQWFANRVTRWLGTISYALFILHYPILLGIKAWGGEALHRLSADSALGGVMAYSVTIGAVLLLSYLAWRFIERPTHRWLKAALSKAP